MPLPLLYLMLMIIYAMAAIFTPDACHAIFFDTLLATPIFFILRRHCHIACRAIKIIAALLLPC